LIRIQSDGTTVDELAVNGADPLVTLIRRRGLARRGARHRQAGAGSG